MSLPQFIGMVVVFAFVAILLMHIWEETVMEHLRLAKQIERETRVPPPRPFDWQKDLDTFD